MSDGGPRGHLAAASRAPGESRRAARRCVARSLDGKRDGRDDEEAPDAFGNLGGVLRCAGCAQSAGFRFPPSGTTSSSDDDASMIIIIRMILSVWE